MMVMLPPVVVLPFVLALLLALAPAGLSARRLAGCAMLSAALTLLLALGCLVPAGAAWLGGAAPAWRNDPLARTLALLPASSWFLVSWRALQPGETRRSSSSRWQRWPVAAQLAAAASMAMCRADLLALLPPLAGVLLLATWRDDPAARGRTAALAAVPVMAIGVSVLSVLAGAPARWALLNPAATAGRAQTAGLLLVSMPMLVLSVAATLRPALASRPDALRGLSRVLIMVAALVVALRGSASAPLSPMLWCVGSGAIALSLLLLPACRGLPARLALAVSLQNGVALLAVAVGGAGGIAAAVMIEGFLVLLLPVALWFPLDTGSARLRMLAVAAVVGLPPFGPFAAGLVLLVRLSGTMPAAAVLVLLAAALSAISVLDAARREQAPSPGLRVTAWFGGASLVLLAALWLGLAMPGLLSDWLLAIAEMRS